MSCLFVVGLLKNCNDPISECHTKIKSTLQIKMVFRTVYKTALDDMFDKKEEEEGVE